MFPRALTAVVVTGVCAWLCGSVRAAGSYRGLRVNNFEPYDAGLFSPVENLGSLSTKEFTSLSHPVFPKYVVRIKKASGFCDDTVKYVPVHDVPSNSLLIRVSYSCSAYTGYIDIEARHLFFYFFESRNDPATDDVIFWTNGGPGCSSALGLLMENGERDFRGLRTLYGQNMTYKLF